VLCRVRELRTEREKQIRESERSFLKMPKSWLATALALSAIAAGCGCAEAAPTAWLDQPLIFQDGKSLSKEFYDDPGGSQGYLAICGVVTDLEFS
jgi:hypothetical protein